MSDLERAIIIAVAAHKGQKDKAGAPYILHPLRIMLNMDTETEQIVAILHDVIEDTDLTFDHLRKQGFSDDIIDAITHLTRADDEPYETYINRIKDHSIAKKVKLSDLKDNMNMDRIANITPNDITRIEKYKKAFLTLTLKNE